MTMNRRNFMTVVGAGAAGTAISCTTPTTPPIQRPPATAEQKWHPDFQSNLPGVEYFFLGNGRLLVAIQSVASADAGTQAGILLMSPDHFGRKASSFLYHPERGLVRSRFSLEIDKKRFSPEFTGSSIRRDDSEGFPKVIVEWTAGPFRIEEILYCPINESILVRDVRVRNTSTSPATATGLAVLYPNLMLFDEYAIDRNRKTLTAIGYHRLQLFTTAEATCGDRHLNLPLGEIAPGGEKAFTIFITLDQTREEFESKGLEHAMTETRKQARSRADLQTGNSGYDHLLRSARASLRAAVARSGKVDGGIWQYNLEWVWDQSQIAMASCMLGHLDIAETILRRILTHSIDEDGGAFDASRKRPPELVELNQNGILLKALGTYWAWSGNDHLLRDHWDTIVRAADFLLRPDCLDPESGLLKNKRELWERDPMFGIEEGYELAHQLYVTLGLDAAVEMATHLGKATEAVRWGTVSRRMNDSFLNHPKLSLIEEGRFIKRRLANGGVQRTLLPPDRSKMPPGMPLAVEKVSYCDPCSTITLPIAWEVVDPKGEIATKTLQAIEPLWNQRWDIGGYGRYDVTSEPDSPGPWPLASLFIARAQLEAGQYDKVLRTLDWVLQIPGGKAGSWFEFYGERPVPPLPPVGIVVWVWAEIAALFVHHMLGVRPTPGELRIRPRLLPGLETVTARLFVHGHEIRLTVRRAAKPVARVNGREIDMKDGSLTFVPSTDCDVEIAL